MINWNRFAPLTITPQSKLFDKKTQNKLTFIDSVKIISNVNIPSSASSSTKYPMNNFLTNVQKSTSNLITNLKRELEGSFSDSSSSSRSSTPHRSQSERTPSLLQKARPLADDLSNLSSLSSLPDSPPTVSHQEVIMRTPSELSFAFIEFDRVESLSSALSESTEEHKVTIERWVDQMIKLGGTDAVEGLPTLPTNKDIYLLLDSLIRRLEGDTPNRKGAIGPQQYGSVVNVILTLNEMLAESHLSIQQDEGRSERIAQWIKGNILKPNREITPNESRLLMHLSWPITRALLTEFRTQHPNAINLGSIDHILMATDPDNW